MIIPFNKNWKYIEGFKQIYISTDFQDKEFREVILPHINEKVSYNYVNENTYTSCYRNSINISKLYEDKCIFIDFEGIAAYSEFYLNGEFLDCCREGKTSFSIELTDKLKFGENNILVVKIDSTERNYVYKFGEKISNLTYGGICGEVNLRILNKVFIENVFVKPRDFLTSKRNLDVVVCIENDTEEEQEAEVELVLRNGDNIIGRSSKCIHMNKKRKSETEIEIESIRSLSLRLNDIEYPNLYTVEASVMTKNNMVDLFKHSIELDEIKIAERGFCLR